MNANDTNSWLDLRHIILMKTNKDKYFFPIFPMNSYSSLKNLSKCNFFDEVISHSLTQNSLHLFSVFSLILEKNFFFN